MKNLADLNFSNHMSNISFKALNLNLKQYDTREFHEMKKYGMCYSLAGLEVAMALFFNYFLKFAMETFNGHELNRSDVPFSHK